MNQESISNKLSELFELHKSGALTKEEYDQLKAEIINKEEVPTIKERVNENEPEKEITNEIVTEQAKELKGNDLKSNHSSVEIYKIPKSKFRRNIIIIISLCGLIFVSLILIKVHEYKSDKKDKKTIVKKEIESNIKLNEEVGFFSGTPKRAEVENAIMHGLKGKVKSVEEKYFILDFSALRESQGLKELDETNLLYYDEDGKLIKESHYDGFGNLDMETTFDYNLSGKLIVKTEVALSKKVISTFRWDAYEKLKSIEIQIPSGIYSYDYLYDKKENQITENRKMHGETAVYGNYKYDIKGRIIESNELSVKSTFKYNNNSELIEKTIGEKNDGLKYNDLGYLIEIIEFNPDSSIDQRNTFQYDQLGNQAENKVYNYKFDKYGNQIDKKNHPDGIETSKTTERYEYDNFGNWVKKSTFENDEMDTPSERIDRIIKYYL